MEGPAIGYQSYAINVKWTTWMQLKCKLIAKFGGMNGKSALRCVWTDDLERNETQAAGAPDQQP